MAADDEAFSLENAHRQASDLYKAQDWQGLLKHSKRWTEAGAENADAWNNLGLAYSDLNRHDEAITAFREAIRINPEYADAWNNLGIAYSDLNRHDDTITAFREAIRINPEYAGAWYNLGVAYNALNRHAEADNARQQSMRLKILQTDNFDNHPHLNRFNERPMPGLRRLLTQLSTLQPFKEVKPLVF